MSRPTRKTKRTYKIFCEGDTEYNYFENMRSRRIVSLKIKLINFRGGGYAGFLAELKKDSNTNCIAKFINVDGDRASKESEEAKALKALIEYCIIQNESNRTPHILIVNYPDFEYIACLHCPEYKGKDTTKFIVDMLHYRDLEEFKSDEKVYEILHSKNRSHEIMLSKIESMTKFINNEITVNKSRFEIRVSTKYIWDSMGKRSSNMNDFFEVVEKMTGNGTLN